MEEDSSILKEEEDKNPETMTIILSDGSFNIIPYGQSIQGYICILQISCHQHQCGRVPVLQAAKNMHHLLYSIDRKYTKNNTFTWDMYYINVILNYYIMLVSNMETLLC